MGMSLFGTSPFPRRGDCHWSNDAGMRVGDQVPTSLHRQRGQADDQSKDEGMVGLQGLMDAAGPHRGTGSVGGRFMVPMQPPSSRRVRNSNEAKRDGGNHAPRRPQTA